MKEHHYQRLNADLGLEFHLFSMEHPEWMAANIPQGALVVIQTDDPHFNAWSRSIAEKNKHLESPAPPMVLIHVRELRPKQSRIVRADAELVKS